jgi:hypothetical protein
MVFDLIIVGVSSQLTSIQKYGPVLVGTALAVCLTIGLAVGLSGGSSSSNSSDLSPTFSRGVVPIPNNKFELI